MPADVYKEDSTGPFVVAMVLHQTYLMRYSAYVQMKIADIMSQSEYDMADYLNAKLTIAGLVTPGDYLKLIAVMDSIWKIREKVWRKAREYMEDEMLELANDEPDNFYYLLLPFLTKDIGFKSPTDPVLASIVNDRPFQGHTLSEWFDTLIASDKKRIRNAIQLGLALGENAATIARRVVGSAAAKGANGATEGTRSQIQAVVRTAVSHVATSSRNEMLRVTPELAAQEVYTAVLDNRTTMFCRDHDGRIYKVNEGPQTPAHMNCRSIRILLINGKKPTVPTLTSWLDSLTDAEQDDTLGERLAKAYRNKTITIDSYKETYGTPLSLQDLRDRYN